MFRSVSVTAVNFEIHQRLNLGTQKSPIGLNQSHGTLDNMSSRQARIITKGPTKGVSGSNQPYGTFGFTMCPPGQQACITLEPFKYSGHTWDQYFGHYSHVQCNRSQRVALVPGSLLKMGGGESLVTFAGKVVDFRFWGESLGPRLAGEVANWWVWSESRIC